MAWDGASHELGDGPRAMFVAVREEHGGRAGEVASDGIAVIWCCAGVGAGFALRWASVRFGVEGGGERSSAEGRERIVCRGLWDCGTHSTNFS